MFIRPRHTSGGLNRVTGSKIAVIILIALWVQCFCLFRVVCTWTVCVWSWSTASLHTWTLDLWWNQPLRRQQRRATTTVRSVYDNMTMLMTRRGRLPNFSTSGWDIVIHRFDWANFYRRGGASQSSSVWISALRGRNCAKFGDQSSMFSEFVLD